MSASQFRGGFPPHRPTSAGLLERVLGFNRSAYNIDLTQNVYEAAVRGGANRMVFASSNWVVAGHRFATGELTTTMERRGT